MELTTKLALYKSAVQQLKADFGWTLLDDEEFVTRVRAELANQPQVSLREAKNAAQGIYSETLYTACQHPEQCEQAYIEVYQYLCAIARYKQPDIAEDAAQQAIELIYEKIEQCHTPRTFLKFAQYKLLDAAKRLRRLQHADRETSLEALEDKWALDGFAEADVESPEEKIIRHDLAQKVRACIERVFQCFTRAHRQLHAVLLKYVEALSDSEIAQRLGTTSGSVRVLRTRGLAKLRDCLKSEDITG